MSFLDQKNSYQSFDSANYYQLIYDFPQQLEVALKLSFADPSGQLELLSNISQVVICGVGGSAIGGDLVASLLRYTFSIPIVVIRQYRLPAAISKKALIVVSSYSGNTEETLSIYNEVRARNFPMVVLTTGGELLQRVRSHRFPYCQLPEGYPPRAALGFSFVPLLGLLNRLGLINSWSEAIREAAGWLLIKRQDWQREVATEKNVAKQMAQRLVGQIPIIYASGDLLETVALRWKCQLCENSKMLAFCNWYPEFNHNELVGWNILSGREKQMVVINLQDREDHPQVQKRQEIISAILASQAIEVINIVSEGNGFLSRLLYLTFLGDLVSYYLAILNQVEPKPVKVIDRLKFELAKSPKIATV